MITESNVLSVTWKLALKIWWSISWRSILVLTLLVGVMVLVAWIFTGSPHFEIHGLASLPFAVAFVMVPGVLGVYGALKKQFKKYRIVILSTQNSQVGE